MKATELYMRCVKARIVSWLNTTQVGAIVPTVEGPPLVLAVYSNGRYVEPEPIRIPNSPAEMWGPDGPIYRGQGEAPPPEEPPATDEEGTDGDGQH